MSENKDIQKVENDKDKIEYEKFHWEISAIKRFNICIVIIVLGIFICALFNISYKINEHNKVCAKKFDSLTKDVVIDLPLIQKTDSNVTAILLESIIKQIDKHYSMKLGEIQTVADTRLSRGMNNLNLWITVWAVLMGIISIGLPMFLSFIDFRKREFEKRELQKSGNYYKKIFEEDKSEFDTKIKKATKEQADQLEKQLIEVEGQSKIMFLLHLLSTLCNFSSTSFPESAERDQCVYDIVMKTSSAFDKIYIYYNQHRNYKPDTSFHSLIVFLIISCDQIKITISNRKVLRLLSDLTNTTEELEKKFCRYMRNKTEETDKETYEEFLEALKSTNYALDNFKNGLKQLLAEHST